MQHYELMYVIPVSVSEEELPGVKREVQTLITQAQGKIYKEEDLGKKKLAYAIQQQRHGTYVTLEFDLEENATAEFDRKLRLQSYVLRFLLSQKEFKTPEQLQREKQMQTQLSARRQEKFAKQREEAAAKVSSPKVKELLKAHGQDQGQEAAAKVSSPKVSLEELDKKLDKIMEDNML